MTSRRIRRYRNREELATAVASRLLDTLLGLQQRQPLAQVCLCGGVTSMAVCREFARMVPDSSLDPARLELWWADEAYTPTAEGTRNVGQVLGVLAGAFHLDPARTHPMPAGGEGSVDVGTAALQYAAELGDTRFDVCLLSLGTHGQVAALFDDEVHTSSTVVGVHDAPVGAPERISLTVPAINRSREVWVMASGEHKAGVVAEALEPGATLPSARVSGTRATEWFVDADAARDLPRYVCGW